MNGPRPVFHLVTCEYPPEVGGVADHTHALAGALAGAGEHVHVWCPTREPLPAGSAPVTVHGLPDRFGAEGLRALQRGLDESPPPRRLFVQWVPHGYGRRALNVAFCAWVLRRARFHGDRVEIMVHEPFLAFDRARPRQSGAAAVHRAMLATLFAAASAVWLATPSFEPLVRPYGFGRPLGYRWLPVPSPITPTGDTELVGRIRARWPSPVLAHFGTFSPLVTATLGRAIELVGQRRPDVTWLLIGRDGEPFASELSARVPGLAGRVVATGTVDADLLSAHVLASDVFVQPYPDGVTARRTSATALLAHGRAIVTTSGYLTEPFWHADGAVRLVPAGSAESLAGQAIDLLADPSARATLGAAARAMFVRRFSMADAVGALLGGRVTGLAHA